MITLGSGIDAGWAWMAVQDEGPGLPEVPESGRVGLGLSIVTQIAEAHGGHLALVPRAAATWGRPWWSGCPQTRPRALPLLARL